MPERLVRISLSAPGVEPTHVDGIFDEFSLGRRIQRSAGVFMIGLLITIPVAFVPIVHLVGVPLLLLASIILAIRQLTFTGRLHAAAVPCPKCGEPNRIGGGLGRRSLAPRDHTCDSCRRGLTLRIEPIGEMLVADPAVSTS